MSAPVDPIAVWLRAIAELFGFSLTVTPRLALLLLVPSILGILSDLACIFVFFRIKLKSPLYTYLRAYSIINLLISCTLFCQFFYFYYPLTNSYSMTVINSYVTGPLLAICFLNSSFLDILILLDRLSVFMKQVKEWLKLISPINQIIILFIVGVVFDIPFFLLIVPQKFTLMVVNGTEYSFWFSNVSPLALSHTGFGLLMFIVVVNYGFVMIAQIALNIGSGILIRRHLKRRASRAGTTSINQSLDVKTNLMVTTLCSLSFAEHLLVIVFNLGLYFFSAKINLYLLKDLTFFGLSMRRFFDFFFFYKFNKVFRKQFLVSIRVSEDVTTHHTGTGGL